MNIRWKSMPRVSQEHNMSEVLLNSIEEVSVVDVYDLATEIGAECEKIIDLYGAKSVESLIPKCINALELLEGLAVKNERETSLIQELNDRITKLENEKAERAETKKKFEKVSSEALNFHREPNYPYAENYKRLLVIIFL